MWSVVLPTARSGIATAVVLGIARTAGETAPLLFTSFGATLLNANPLSGPQESLPLYIYGYIREPNTNTIERGQTGALVLMVIVLLLFLLARYLGRDRTVARKKGPLGRLVSRPGTWARGMARSVSARPRPSRGGARPRPLSAGDQGPA